VRPPWFPKVSPPLCQVRGVAPPTSRPPIWPPLFCLVPCTPPVRTAVTGDSLGLAAWLFFLLCFLLREARSRGQCRLQTAFFGPFFVCSKPDLAYTGTNPSHHSPDRQAQPLGGRVPRACSLSPPPIVSWGHVWECLAVRVRERPYHFRVMPFFCSPACV